MSFKCMKCGKDLDSQMCECGFNNYLPSSKYELLFNRANNYRRDFKFDKALEIYNSIDDEIGYYGAILCKYGVVFDDTVVYLINEESVFNQREFKKISSIGLIESLKEIDKKNSEFLDLAKDVEGKEFIEIGSTILKEFNTLYDLTNVNLYKSLSKAKLLVISAESKEEFLKYEYIYKAFKKEIICFYNNIDDLPDYLATKEIHKIGEELDLSKYLDTDKSYNMAIGLINNNLESCIAAKSILERINSDKAKEKLQELKPIIIDLTYKKATKLVEKNTIDDYLEAKILFQTLNGYKSSLIYIDMCDEKIKKIKIISVLKKSSILLIPIAIIVIVLCIVLNVDEKPSSDGCCIYTLVDGKYYVSGVDDSAREVQIPKFFDSIEVVGIKSNAFANTNITGVKIDDNIVSIGYGAFYNCKELRTIEYNSSFNGFENYDIFYNVGKNAETSVYFGSSITEIPDYMFYINDPNARPNIKYVSSSATKIGDSAFLGCTKLKTIETSNLTDIGEKAFYFCTLLNEINLSNINTINEEAFNGCMGLNKLVLGTNITEIKKNVFGKCENLNIYYLGNETNFFDITIQLGNQYSDVYYYSQEELLDGKSWHYVSGSPKIWE